MGNNGFSVGFPNFLPTYQGNPVSSYAQGVQNAATRQNTEHNRMLDERSKEFRSLLGASTQGSQEATQRLQQRYPSEFQAFQGQQLELQNKQATQQETQRAGRVETTSAGLRQLDALEKNPKNWATVRTPLAQALGLKPDELPKDLPDQGSLEAFRNHLESEYRTHARPQAATSYSKQALEEGYPAGTQANRDRAAELQAHAEKVAKELKAKGAPLVTVNTGNMSPTSATTTDLQKGILEAQAASAAYRNIDQYIPDIRDLLSIQGKAKTTWAGWLDRVKKSSPNDAARIQRSAAFEADVGQIHQAEKKQVFGLTAAEREQEQALKQFLNTEMGPEQFIGSLAASKSRGQRALRAKQKAAREGIDLGEEAILIKANNLYKSGDQMRSKADQNARYNELTSKLFKQGLSKDEAETAAIDSMTEDGYFSEKELNESNVR